MPAGLRARNAGYSARFRIFVIALSGNSLRTEHRRFRGTQFAFPRATVGSSLGIASGAMQQIDEAKVNEAVRDCLFRCERAEEILPEIARYLDALEKRGGWSETELHEVELGVVRILFGILDSALYPSETTRGQEGESGSPVSRP